MADHPNPPLSEAAQAVADSKIPPGDEYEEIREQVREIAACVVGVAVEEAIRSLNLTKRRFDFFFHDRIATYPLPILLG
jgi:hypothetical protein